MSLQLNVAGAGLGLHIALAGLLGIDVAGAGVDGEAAVKPVAWMLPEPVESLALSPTALIGDVARAGVGVEKRRRPEPEFRSRC